MNLLHIYKLTCLLTYIYTNLHYSYIHTYIHTYIHINKHIYKNTEQQLVYADFNCDGILVSSFHGMARLFILLDFVLNRYGYISKVEQFLSAILSFLPVSLCLFVRYCYYSVSCYFSILLFLEFRCKYSMQCTVFDA